MTKLEWGPAFAGLTTTAAGRTTSTDGFQILLGEVHERDGVFVGETADAEGFVVATAAFKKAFDGKVRQAVDAQVIADLRHRLVGRDEFLFGRRIDAVV